MAEGGRLAGGESSSLCSLAAGESGRESPAWIGMAASRLERAHRGVECTVSYYLSWQFALPLPPWSAGPDVRPHDHLHDFIDVILELVFHFPGMPRAGDPPAVLQVPHDRPVLTSSGRKGVPRIKTHERW